MNPIAKDDEQDRLKMLLRQAIAPVDPNAYPARDLWPPVLRRLDERSAAHRSRRVMLDWALLAGIGVFAAFSPGWIPVLLYYL